ncbi:MAG: glycosyltransferase, partial [Nakamurella sp.]
MTYRSDQVARPVEDRAAQDPDQCASLGVCVVNYHSRALIVRLIDSLAAARGSTTLRVACVDNSESDREFWELRQLEQRAAELGISLTVTQATSNVGYAAGNNMAAQLLIAAGVDFLLVVNPDVTVRAGRLDTLCRLVGSTPRSIYTAKTWRGNTSYSGLSSVNRWTSASAQLPARLPTGLVACDEIVGRAQVHPRTVMYPGGHFLAMSTRTWVQLGGLCPDFFLFGEEADLAVRAVDVGVAIVTTDLIEVDHEVGATTGATAAVADKSSITLRQASRSAVIFSRKHNPYRTPTVVLCRLVLAAVVLVRRGPTACLQVLGGIVDGLGATL